MTAVTESDVQQDGAVTVRPLQPTIGAEIGGVDFPRLLERVLIADEPQYADL